MGEADFNGTWLDVLVFASEGDDAAETLRQVKAATELIAPALYIVNATNADLPSEVAPPGLLWSVETGAMQPGVILRWKMRDDNHRDPDISPPPPPNVMVQCYPTNSSHLGYVGDAKVTYTGYFLNAYRLDKNGTGQVYSEIPEITDDTGKTQNKPPEWEALIVPVPPLRGIPFADPPPLIVTDVI